MRCRGTRFLPCECWPGDCICGAGDEPCFGCEDCDPSDPDEYEDDGVMDRSDDRIVVESRRQREESVMPPEATTEPVVQPVTVGRIVHLFPNEYHREFIQKTSGGNLLVAGEPVAAVIVRVWNPDMVNLKVITDGRHDVWLPSVGSPKFMGTHESRNTYWDWPARS